MVKIVLAILRSPLRSVEKVHIGGSNMNNKLKNLMVVVATIIITTLAMAGVANAATVSVPPIEKATTVAYRFDFLDTQEVVTYSTCDGLEVDRYSVDNPRVLPERFYKVGANPTLMLRFGVSNLDVNKAQMTGFEFIVDPMPIIGGAGNVLAISPEEGEITTLFVYREEAKGYVEVPLDPGTQKCVRLIEAVAKNLFQQWKSQNGKKEVTK